MLLDLLPKASVLLNADLLGSIELVEAAEVHVLGQQRDHVLVESLPVRVLEVVPVAMRSQILRFFFPQSNVKRRCPNLLLAALVFVALDDGEGAGVLVVLHHKPDRDGTSASIISCSIVLTKSLLLDPSHFFSDIERKVVATHQPRVSLSLE